MLPLLTTCASFHKPTKKNNYCSTIIHKHAYLLTRRRRSRTSASEIPVKRIQKYAMSIMDAAAARRAARVSSAAGWVIMKVRCFHADFDGLYAAMGLRRGLSQTPLLKAATTSPMIRGIEPFYTGRHTVTLWRWYLRWLIEEAVNMRNRDIRRSRPIMRCSVLLNYI